MFINDYYNNHIIDIFGGINNMLKYPILRFKSHYITVDYIDNIYKNDITAPIMLCIDIYEHPFIVIKYIINKRVSVEIIFQRYTGYKGDWSNGSRYHKYICGGWYFIANNKLDNYTKCNTKRFFNLIIFI